MPRRTHTLALALLPLIAACQPATTPQEGAPSGYAAQADARPATVPADDAALATFLASVYGSSARLQGEWGGVPTDVAFRAQGGETADGTVTRSVCAREDITLSDQRNLLLAVCGTPREFGHPTPGVTDVFLLQDDGGRWTASARGHFEKYGSMGRSGEVDGERFGAELAGFIVDSGFTGQGHTTINRNVLLPREGRFVEAATFLSGMDDNTLRAGCKEGESPFCAAGKAYDVDFKLHIDDSDPSATAYPLVVQEQGTACGKTMTARHTLQLDAATFKYDVPPALHRELACETATP